jgi:hypothetical protein
MNIITSYHFRKPLAKGILQNHGKVLTANLRNIASDLCFTNIHGQTDLSLFAKRDSGKTRARSTERQR